MSASTRYVRILVLSILTSGLSASAGLDSLWQVWQDQGEPDTVRFKALDDFIWDGLIYSNSDSAIILSEIALRFASEKGMMSQKSTALNTLGVSYWSKGDYVRAIRYYEMNLRLCDSLGNDEGTATALNNIGAIYHNQGDYPRALQNFKRSLKLNEERRDTHGIAVSISNIGMIYREQGELDNALSNARQALLLYEQLNEKYGIAKELMSIGNIHVARNELEQGLEYYQRSTALKEELNDLRSLINAYEMTGSVLMMLDRTDEAMALFQRALALAIESGDQRGLCTALISYGVARKDVGQTKEAAELCLAGLEKAMELSILKQKQKACDCLYKVYKTMNYDAEALKYHEMSMAYLDSLQETETAKRLQQMEFESRMMADSAAHYAQDLMVKAEFETELLEEQSLRNLAVLSGVFALFLAIGLYMRARFIKRSNLRLQAERDRSDELLLNILPYEVAEELKLTGQSEARDFDNVTVLFTDFQEFTETAQKLSAKELVEEINMCFKAFDEIILKYGIEKIKTIGDAYMAAGGLHVPRTSEPADVIRAALEMQAFMIKRRALREASNLPAFEMRVGIHTGPVVAGIVGVKKFQYDIWGDTVNTASRMESHGGVGTVNISHETYLLVKDETDFSFESRGRLEVKGKGEMDMYFVRRSSEGA